MIYYQITHPFYTLNNGTLEPGVYSLSELLTPRFTPELTQHAERVWLESETGVVTYIKHRSYAEAQVVDMKEFAWIKLSAKMI